ncbi:MAG TPA: hypothetical protein VK586_14195, partial [Streptosporangiaceae bacterium]|nr:hypothetical protein [Streptosporangiaceae bacterium]
DGALACESVTISEKPGGPPVTSLTLRSALISLYLQRIRDTLGSHHGGDLVVRETYRDDSAGRINYAGPMPDEWRDFDIAQVRKATRLTPELAAAAYREALASADPDVRQAPTAATAKKLGASRGHVSRLLTQARRDGIEGLGPGRPARRRDSGDQDEASGGAE